MGGEACYIELLKSIYFYSDRALYENEREMLPETKKKTMLIDNTDLK